MRALVVLAMILLALSASPAQGAAGVQLVLVASGSTGGGTISHGVLSVSVGVTRGDLLVVVVGINRALHPVTSVGDSMGDVFTNRTAAAYPAVAPDAWVEVWTAPVKAGGADVVTVHTTSTRDNVVVLEYAGVGGVGNVAAAGGKGTKASVYVSLKSSTSAVVAGGSTFTGSGKGCGFQGPFTGGSLERCLGTTAAKNNVGTMAMSDASVGASGLAVSAGKTGSQSWAMAAVELMG